MHIFTSNNIIIQKFFKGYYRILKEIIIRMKSLTKKIIKVCKKLDFYGQYSLVDNIFLKYAQVASKDLSTYYSDLQNASASAKTIVADMFNILNKIRPEDITVFLNKFSKEDLTALVGDFINDLVILTNSYASDPSNKLVASAITTEQRNLYILPIFNQYFKSSISRSSQYDVSRVNCLILSFCLIKGVRIRSKTISLFSAKVISFF